MSTRQGIKYKPEWPGCPVEPAWGVDTGEGASALRSRQVKRGAGEKGREAPEHPKPLLRCLGTGEHHRGRRHLWLQWEGQPNGGESGENSANDEVTESD